MKDTRTYQEDKMLSGYVMDLQKFDKLLKQAQKKAILPSRKIISSGWKEQPSNYDHK